jgi:hypothetical protein
MIRIELTEKIRFIDERKRDEQSGFIERNWSAYLTYLDYT